MPTPPDAPSPDSPATGSRQRTAELLQRWRDADRRWEATAPDGEGYRAAAIEVVRAWLAYHESVDSHNVGEFALVADDDRIYVAATAAVATTLGYPPEALLGTIADDLAGPADAATTEERWASFVSEGRQDGEFELRRSDGSTVRLQYQARAHYPIAGFHLSRLWPVDET